MKKLIRLAILLGALAAVAWLVKDRLVPAPEPLDEPPPFRPPPPSPPAAATGAAPPPAAAQPPPAPTEAAADDLTEITGIGPTLAERLHALGITSFASLAAADAAALAADLTGAGQGQIEGWIDQAKERQA